MVTTPTELAAGLAPRLSKLKSGSLSVFGDIFGGRVDNVHRISRVDADGECLVLHFDGGETLRVWHPDGVTASETEFTIRDATRVRWEWHYYGREHTPENRYFIEHVRTGEQVRASTDAAWRPRKFSPSTGSPAVEILGFLA